jgi:hypothetical protein
MINDANFVSADDIDPPDLLNNCQAHQSKDKRLPVRYFRD